MPFTLLSDASGEVRKYGVPATMGSARTRHVRDRPQGHRAPRVQLTAQAARHVSEALSALRANGRDMIEVHHLNNSRSQQILWLLEELELPYELVKYQRNAQTNLAPEELKAIHPLGKSPVIRDDGRTVIESGAIIEYIVRRHGKGRLAPAESSPEWPRHLQLMHYGEGPDAAGS
jgi:hypothetical protein